MDKPAHVHYDGRKTFLAKGAAISKSRKEPGRLLGVSGTI